MSNLKIVIVIILIFIISFSTFAYFAYTFPTTLGVAEKKFFSHNFTNHEKIFLLGSSHVGHLNSTYMQQMVNINKKSNFEIFNLASSSDTPTREINISDQIVKVKPEMIVYGISYRDFRTDNNNNPLPDPKNFFHQLINYRFDTLNTFNPKLITLTFIRNSIPNSQLPRDEFSFSNSPFYIINSEMAIIANDEELKNSSVNKEVSQFNLEDPLKNVEVKNIVNLVHKLQQNHIKVVLFLTPLNRHYLDIIPEKQTLIFNSIILYIKNETNVPIYNLQDKYANFPIWQDSSHVAINEKSLIYSEDVGKIILDELDS